MSLSSSEAQWVPFLEAVKIVMFMIQLLRRMKITAKLPVMVRVDIVGGIFMVSKIATMLCTKCVDIKYKYVNKYVEDGENYFWKWQHSQKT